MFNISSFFFLILLFTASGPFASYAAAADEEADFSASRCVWQKNSDGLFFVTRGDGAQNARVPKQTQPFKQTQHAVTFLTDPSLTPHLKQKQVSQRREDSPQKPQRQRGQSIGADGTRMKEVTSPNGKKGVGGRFVRHRSDTVGGVAHRSSDALKGLGRRSGSGSSIAASEGDMQPLSPSSEARSSRKGSASSTASQALSSAGSAVSVLSPADSQPLSPSDETLQFVGDIQPFSPDEGDLGGDDDTQPLSTGGTELKCLRRTDSASSAPAPLAGLLNDVPQTHGKAKKKLFSNWGPGLEKLELRPQSYIRGSKHYKVADTEERPYSGVCRMEMALGKNSYIGTCSLWEAPNGLTVGLTAGHTLYSREDESPMEGVWVYRGGAPGKDDSPIRASRFTVHPDYVDPKNKNYKPFDLGVIFFDEDVDLSRFALPMRISDESFLSPGRLLEIIGYPVLIHIENDKGSVSFQTLTGQEMYRMFGRVIGITTEGQIRHGASTYEGHSGGPYLIRLEDGRFFVIGVHTYAGNQEAGNVGTLITPDIYDYLVGWVETPEDGGSDDDQAAATPDDNNQADDDAA